MSNEPTITGNTYLVRTFRGQYHMSIVTRASLIPPPFSSPVSITGLTNFQPADIIGASNYNNIDFNNYVFKSTGTAYTLNYTCNVATTIYVLAVGGGGGGSAWGGGGGGAGGVVMNPVNLPIGSNTITINVGAGGVAGASTSSSPTITPTNGSNTTVNFTVNSALNIIACGGGAGGPSNVGSAGGSGGGGGNAPFAGGNSINNNNNYGNAGGNCSATFYCGGGGGAGTIGIAGVNASTINGGAGGNGIQCFLPGISTFAPSGTAYGTYYWGGGGGGCSYNSTTVQYGNGGLGGGGGGTSMTISVAGGSGGTNGINNGSAGTNSTTLSTGGAGGTNTGGGGGSVWWGSGGAGGSGIVIISFPSTLTFSGTQSTVLSSAAYSSNLYNAILNNTNLSTDAYNSIKGAYACRLLNYNYFGPVLTLRYSTDTTGQYTKNFYADICGNMGTCYLGTGQSVSSWLISNGANTTYAYVTKWYNQGMDVSFNSFTGSITQNPIYDVSYGVVNFGYTTTGAYPAGWNQNTTMNVNNNAFPYSDMSYSYTFRHWNLVPGSNGCVLQTGFDTGSTGVQFTGVAMLCNSTGYTVDWETNGIATHNYLYSAVPYAANNVYSTTYTSGTKIRNLYINGTGNSDSSALASVRNQLPNNNVVGTCNSIGWFYGQLYNLYAFQSALSSADRQLVESTPFQFTPLPSISITVNVLSSNSFTASWSPVTSATTYVMYINGAIYGNVSSPQTVTNSTVSTANIYAYNLTNNLLASGSANVNTFPTVNLLYNFSSLTGTSTTTNGSTISTWTDARTGLVGSNYSGCAYRTDVTINSRPTTVGCVSTTLGNTTTIQNYWTWYCVLRTGGTALTGDNNMIYNSSSYALEIGLNGGNLKTCYSAIAWSVGAASVSGGSAGSWIAAVNTNYILTVICSSTNNTASSTQSFTFRINGVDYTPASNTDSRYFYINNPIVGNINSTTQTYMGEQTLYNTNHSVATAQIMEQYLSYKWNIPIGSVPTVAISSPYAN